MSKREMMLGFAVIGIGILAQIPGHDEAMGDMEPMTAGDMEDVREGHEIVALEVTGMT